MHIAFVLCRLIDRAAACDIVTCVLAPEVELSVFGDRTVHPVADRDITHSAKQLPGLVGLHIKAVKVFVLVDEVHSFFAAVRFDDLMTCRVRGAFSLIVVNIKIVVEKHI